MKIRFTKTLTTNRECFVRGKDYEIDRPEADEYVGKGFALDLSGDEPPLAETSKTVKRKRKETVEAAPTAADEPSPSVE